MMTFSYKIMNRAMSQSMYAQIFCRREEFPVNVSFPLSLIKLIACVSMLTGPNKISYLSCKKCY